MFSAVEESALVFAICSIRIDIILPTELVRRVRRLADTVSVYLRDLHALSPAEAVEAARPLLVRLVTALLDLRALQEAGGPSVEHTVNDAPCTLGAPPATEHITEVSNAELQTEPSSDLSVRPCVLFYILMASGCV